MSILDKLFGHEEQPKKEPQQPQYQPPQQQYQPPPQQAQQQAANQPISNDQAIARYQYMLKTAPPETIEQAHQEAFAQLTPEQRRIVLQQLSSTVPRANVPRPRRMTRRPWRAWPLARKCASPAPWSAYSEAEVRGAAQQAD